MRRFSRWLVLGAALIGAAACDGAPTVGACAESYAPSEGAIWSTGCCTGVDLLIVIDTAPSMAEEQALLADALYTFVETLTDPGTEATYHAVESMRVAVVTSNLGVAYGEDLEIPDDGDVPPALLQEPASCAGRGDDGAFQEIEVGSVSIGGEPLACPVLEDAWAESSEWDDDADDDVALGAACLTQQGTEGCGLAQPLASAVAALNREGQSSLLGCGCDLLAVLLVTDEDDCSMEDAPGLFGTPAFEDPEMLDIACRADGSDEYLFDVESLFDAIAWAKGSPGSVLFAAITGVPNEGTAAAACEGRGDEIGACLDREEMQLAPEQPGLPEDEAWAFRPACARSESGATVTSAAPARRIVELANDHFGQNAYVSSICNVDWGPAMDDFAKMILSRMPRICASEPLDWDPVEKVPSGCEMMAAFTNPEGNACPWPLDDGAEAIVERSTGSDGSAITTVTCPLPKIPTEFDCADRTPEQLAALDDGFGWAYCENRGDLSETPGVCLYDLTITQSAQHELLGAPVEMRCLLHDDCTGGGD